MTTALWIVHLDRLLTSRETNTLLERLPPERRERLERGRRPERWREPLCAYALLTLALRETLQWEEFPPMAWTERGKPYFPDAPGVRFSISHTEGAVLVGISGGAIGVDIEKIRPVRESFRQRLAGGADEEAVFRIWVRREARAKRSGAGISTMLRGEPPLEPGEFYHQLETFPGYAAGVACGDAAVPEQPQLRLMEELL